MADTFKVGELRNERTLFSKTWMNFDGSRTTEFSLNQMHFQDTTGELHDIDTTLYDEADLHTYTGAVELTGAQELGKARLRSIEAAESELTDREDFDYQGLKVPFFARLPRVFDRGYTVGDGLVKISMIPVNATPAKGIIDPGSTDTVTYIDAWEDTDVTLELKSDSVKETIILKSDKAPTTFSFAVEGPLKTDLSAGTMSLAPAWLVDAKGVMRDVKQVSRTDKDYNVFIDLEADIVNLEFPISIDPTIIVGTGGGVTDNQMEAASPTLVKVNPKQGLLGRNDTYRIASKYDVLKTDIFKGVKITSADMNILQVAVVGPPQQVTGSCHAIIADYDTSKVNWNNQPSHSETLMSQVQTWNSGSYSWISFNIAGILQALADGTKVFGFLFKNVNKASIGASEFALTQYYPPESRPFMSVSYNMPPTKPVLTAPNGGETWNSAETIRWNGSSDIVDGVLSVPAESNKNYDILSLGQVFTVGRDDWAINEVSLWMQQPDGYWPTGKFQLVNINANGGFGSTVYAEKEVALPVDMGKITLPVPNLSFTAGTLLGIKYTDKLNFSRSITVPQDIANPYKGGYMIRDNTIDYNTDMRAEVRYKEGKPTAKLKYQIQLSSDNGSTWKDIVPLSLEGATSKVYDFTNEPNSSVSRIRVRAYDGDIYGEWDQSDGVFTIFHNSAPLMPTNLAPSSGIYNRLDQITMTWKHNDPNGSDPQSKFELQWRIQGTVNWNTVLQSTSNQFYAAPGGTFPPGKIEWRVRTFDQSGLGGDYSSSAVFTAAVGSSVPTITFPTEGTILTVANPTITWSHTAQVSYWLQVKTLAGAVVFEDKKDSTNKAATILYDLIDLSDYRIELAVKDGNGVWSNFTTVNVKTMYNPPVRPTIITTVDEEHGWITLDIDSAAITGNTPKTSHYDVYRGSSELTQESWTRVAKGMKVNQGGMQEITLAIWTDRTPTPNTEVWYKVRAYSVDGAYIDSEVAIANVKMKFVQLALASDPEKYVTLKKRDAGKEVSSRKSASSDFVGREYPLTEFGENLSREYSYNFKVYSWEEVLKMREFAHTGEALLLRDNWGKKDYVTIDSIDVTEARTYWTVSIKPIKIWYTEGI